MQDLFWKYQISGLDIILTFLLYEEYIDGRLDQKKSHLNWDV